MLRRNGRIDIWDTETAERVDQLNTHRDEMTAVAISPTGSLAATHSDDDTVHVWELGTGKSVCAFPASDSHYRYGTDSRRLAFTADGRGLLFTSDERPAMADPMTGKRLELPGELRNSKGRITDLSRDGETLVTSDKNQVTMWSWPAGKKLVEIFERDRNLVEGFGRPRGCKEFLDRCGYSSRRAHLDGIRNVEVVTS